MGAHTIQVTSRRQKFNAPKLISSATLAFSYWNASQLARPLNIFTLEKEADLWVSEKKLWPAHLLATNLERVGLDKFIPGLPDQFPADCQARAQTRTRTRARTPLAVAISNWLLEIAPIAGLVGHSDSERYYYYYYHSRARVGLKFAIVMRRSDKQTWCWLQKAPALMIAWRNELTLTQAFVPSFLLLFLPLTWPTLMRISLIDWL